MRIPRRKRYAVRKISLGEVYLTSRWYVADRRHPLGDLWPHLYAERSQAVDLARELNGLERGRVSS